MSEKEFDKFIQNQIAGISNHIETLEQLSPEQYRHYQINKRAIQRLRYQVKVSDADLEKALRNINE